MHALAPTMPADLRAILESLGVDARGERPRSERVLERLLDLSRSVALGGVLDQPLHAEASEPVEHLAHAQAQLARLRLLEGRLVGALRELRGQIDRRFEGSFVGGRGAPDAAALHAMLDEAGALEAGRDAARETIAGKVTRRYVAIVDGALCSALEELGWLQKDVHEALQRGGAEARRLCALDRVLDGVFRAELEASRGQLEEHLARTLEAQLGAACAALAVDAGAGALRPWFAPRGCVGAFLRNARRLCHALLDLEWSALMAVLQAAMQAERTHTSEASSSQENDDS